MLSIDILQGVGYFSIPTVSQKFLDAFKSHAIDAFFGVQGDSYFNETFSAFSPLEGEMEINRVALSQCRLKKTSDVRRWQHALFAATSVMDQDGEITNQIST